MTLKVLTQQDILEERKQAQEYALRLVQDLKTHHFEYMSWECKHVAALVRSERDLWRLAKFSSPPCLIGEFGSTRCVIAYWPDTDWSSEPE